MDMQNDIAAARGKFVAMAASYCMGVFNDNYFKQAAMLLAVSGGLSDLQGTATVLFALPFVLFSSAAGWFADRFPKKHVVIGAKILELSAMLVGAIGVVIGNWSFILAMLFIMGVQATFFSPALNGSIPDLYPTFYIPKANAILKLVTTLSILLGIASAGISLDNSPLHFRHYSPGTLLVAVVALIVAVLGLVSSFGVPYRSAAAKEKPFPWLGPLTSLQDLWLICKDRQLLVAFFSDNFFYFLATIVVLTINTIGIRQLEFSQTITSLLSVALMLGVCVGSFLAARLVTVDSWTRLLRQAALGMAAGLFMAGMTVMLPPPLRLIWIVIGLTATGVFGGLFLIPVASFLQVRPAPTEKGKVLATVNFSGFICIMLAGEVFSALDALVSPAAAMAIIGIFGLFAAAVVHILLQGDKQ